MKKILVLDANQRSALVVIRSLGKHALYVVAADYMSPTIGSASRYAAASFQYADPTRDPARFQEDISRGVRKFGIDVVIPATDLTSMLLVSQPECVAPAWLACPSAESYEALTNKQQLLSLALELGVPVPDTRVTSTASEIRAAATEFGYPVVLKPGRSRYLKDNRVVSTAVRIVDNPGHLDTTTDRLEWLGDIPCLVQRFIPGHGAGIFAICDHNRPVAWFAHKRLREKPPSGGVSVLSESVAVDPSMQASAEKLLSAARWSGVAMIEFRMASSGTPYLMEVNGRFWGSLQLSVDCGVDFPWLLYRLGNGDIPGKVSSYATGRRLRWLLGDLDNLMLQLRDSKLGRGAKSQVAAQFIGSFFDLSCRQEIFRWSDPRPALREARQWFGALTK
jgi:predicted ATP-grasp superfamily ATP-dependent carboligase